MPRLALICLLALTVGLAAGCGDDEETTVTEQQTVTETAQPPETEAQETTTTAEQPPAGSHGPRYFQTPSGNIGCYLDASGARCDIRERSWKPPPEPASCELDWGQGIALGKNGASFVCAGDTTLGGPATLGYGSSSQRGRILCESEEAGITCSNTSTGAGFFLSRESYRIF